ncbi:MAG: phenylalanine--tRNA ligase subunit alpha [Thaumarchaeota archaeon S13]|nr:MAG: phenylalanine--tRNA ligase subunit alpha [Thaumarchaeota archaeon S13]
MRPALHDIERRILAELASAGAALDEEAISRSTGLGIDQVRRGTEWLRHKGLATVEESLARTVELGEAGAAAARDGLPERRLAEMLIDGPVPLRDAASRLGDEFGPAMGAARAHGWVSADAKDVSLAGRGPPPPSPEEAVLRELAGRGTVAESDVADQAALEALSRRPGMVTVSEVAARSVTPTREGADAAGGAQEAGAIDVEADAPVVYPARAHPLREAIAEVREAFVTLGFSEVTGDLCQPCFWNFDALFTPQDHPAREMQDTFYLEGMSHTRFAGAPAISAVSAEHKAHWGPTWSPAESRRSVLRTHTTCATLRHLAETRPERARAFALGSVFRNEKVSYKHLVEFNQVEGVVVGADVTLRGLMGIQAEFYRRMGMERVKFWPTYFPYTEPSLQSMVYSESLGRWIELFGMGILRPEVTRPLGIRGRVLAWGGGIERVAMLRSGLSDVRELYANRLAWLRGGGA